MTNNIGILLAAGRGTRLQPFTDTTPKPLVKYLGKSLLEWNLEEMYDLVDYYIVTVNWLKEKIISEIGDNYRGKKIIYAVQENPKGGTLDSFRVAVDMIENPDFSGLIVANSDDIRGKEYYTEIGNFVLKNPSQPIIAAKVENDLSKLSQFGVIIANQDGSYKEIVEKPAEFISNLINIGLYYFPKKMVELIPVKPAIYEKEEYLIDILNEWAKVDRVDVVSPTNGFYKTVTTVADLPEGN